MSQTTKNLKDQFHFFGPIVKNIEITLSLQYSRNEGFEKQQVYKWSSAEENDLEKLAMNLKDNEFKKSFLCQPQNINKSLQ